MEKHSLRSLRPTRRHIPSPDAGSAIIHQPQAPPKNLGRRPAVHDRHPPPSRPSSGSDTDPEAPYTRDNATPVTDDTTGDGFLVATGEHATRGTRLPYVRKSTDDGLTFGAPRALTRLSGKTSAGRLVVGAYSAANIYFNRFTPTAIGLPGTFDGTILPQPTPDAGPTTPDSTPDANDAHLTGTTAAVSGRFRQALNFPAPGGHAGIPYSPTIDPGSGDVTCSLLFTHQATPTTPQRALLWAYGHNSTAPQLWIRAIPKDNQILAWAEGSGSRVSLTLQAPDGSAAYGDGAWHHLTLVRSGDRVSLGVDGTTVTRSGLTGSLTAPRAAGVEGIRLGARPDGAATTRLAGSLDEFRLIRRALATDELTALRETNSDPTDRATVAHLAFEKVTTEGYARL
ncbi:LamG-like jellyroll fold domain-containing protein [Streptomyces sp. NY05-11A]|uniref:LamG-like jellyroll fold domain-containing protein n=1 Tax=Streptomyces soliscabiei TaxID=588897 RepID=UPI0039F6CDC0